MINTPKQSSSMTNATRINTGEIWNSNSNQWQNESRTWDDMASLISNTSRVLSSMTNTAKPV